MNQLARGWEDTQPLAASADAGPAIDGLAVAEGWREKFRLIHKAGGPRMPRLKELTARERMKVGFNAVAFFFGPFYYLAKGMWKRAIALFAACFAVVFLVSLILDAAGRGAWGDGLKYGVGAFFAIRANGDYYRKMVLGDNGWW